MRRRFLCQFLPGVRPGRLWRWCIVRWGLCRLLPLCLLLWLLLLLCGVAVGGGLLPRAAVFFGGRSRLGAFPFFMPNPSLTTRFGRSAYHAAAHSAGKKAYHR